MNKISYNTVTMLETIEEEFIQFISQRNGKTLEKVREDYVHTKTLFDFGSVRYKQTCNQAYELNKLLYGEDSDEELIRAYKYHELMHTYRFLSYSFKKAVGGKSSMRLILDILKNKKYKKLYAYFKRFIKKKTKGTDAADIFEPEDVAQLARYLTKNYTFAPSSVVDYGCGPAYVSFEIACEMKAQGLKVPTTHLVDIDSLINEFVLFRFRLHDLPATVITIDKDNMYPPLPAHDLCIATEVMEHIKEPVRVFENINSSLKTGGILHGNFGDHDVHMFHVSPDLANLREKLKKNNYTRLGRMTYRKDTQTEVATLSLRQK